MTQAASLARTAADASRRPAIPRCVPRGRPEAVRDGRARDRGVRRAHRRLRWGRLDAAAARLEDRFRAAPSRPPLYGVPVGVKDIFHADGFETRAGSSVPADALAGPEASTVTALREAGALVLGKTVTTEFAFFDPGPTRNPHDPAHTPGGSSSGSAAAVAAGLCPLALGTQTIGSVARPAAFCGVVGVKPSYGRLPMDGVIPVSPSVDHVGYFTQDVPSARLAASVLYPDWGPLPTLDGPRLGAVDGPYLEQAEPAAVEAFEAQLDRLAAAGHAVERLTAFPDIEAVNERHNRLVAAETAVSHDEWYPAYGDRYGPELRELVERGQGVTAGELAAARAGRGELRDELEARMADAGVDVLLSPSAPGPAPEGLDSTGDPVMNLPWTHSGLPTVTLPAGTVDGLPVGLQCAARFGFDEWLLGWAGELEASLAAN
ncbi:MAG: amidase [Halobacteriales archaeon]|nr:amidase [Halobacteriales archaeon]